MAGEHKSRIALGKRLRTCPSFRCLGVRTDWDAYDDSEKEAIRRADRIYYPGPLYEDLFLSLGKQVFPANSRRFIGNKIRQTELFQLLGISHPRTRIYHGRNRRERIGKDFQYPFIAKTPIGSAMGKGVWLIEDDPGLERYLEGHRPAYIQEYLPIDRDIRVVLVNGHVVHAYWRIGRTGDFRNNVSQGAGISLEDVPDEALEFAREVVRLCRFGEAGLDICRAGGRYYVIEANMSYGLEGFHLAGLDIYELLAGMDGKGLL